MIGGVGKKKPMPLGKALRGKPGTTVALFYQKVSASNERVRANHQGGDYPPPYSLHYDYDYDYIIIFSFAFLFHR